jgi:anti-sigma B factor antagonist
MEPARGDKPILTMSGDIDIASEQDWRRRGSELLDANPDLTDIVIDMANVTFLDSRGMAVLIHLHGKALARGGKLTLLTVPPRVAKALSVAGLDQVFQVEPA